MPVQGQSSQQLHGSGVTKGRKEGNRVVGVGANMSNSVKDMALDHESPKGARGKSGENREEILGAEEREPTSAWEVAAERA